MWFADGTVSQIADKRLEEDDNGVMKWKFLLFADDDQKVLYDVEKDDKYDEENDIIRKDFDAVDVAILSDNPDKIRLFVIRAFDGKPTRLTHMRADLTQQINMLHKERSSLNSHIALLQQELHKLRTSTKLAIKESVDIINEARKGGGKIFREEGGEGAPEESYGA